MYCLPIQANYLPLLQMSTGYCHLLLIPLLAIYVRHKSEKERLQNQFYRLRSNLKFSLNRYDIHRYRIRN